MTDSSPTSDSDTDRETRKTEEERFARAAAVEDVRQQRAVELAVAQDRKEQRVDLALAAHENRLQAINGSIAKNAAATEALTVIVKDIKSEQDRRDAVNEALVGFNKDKGSKRFSRAQFFGLILGSLIGILTFALALLQAVHHA